MAIIALHCKSPQDVAPLFAMIYNLEPTLEPLTSHVLYPLCRYDEEDEALLQQADADVLSERKSAMDEWQAFRESKREFVALSQGFKKKMFGARWEPKESRMEHVTMEQVQEAKEEPYNNK